MRRARAGMADGVDPAVPPDRIDAVVRTPHGRSLPSAAGAAAMRTFCPPALGSSFCGGNHVSPSEVP